MKLHIGTKQVTATPMIRAAYNAYRGWTLPADEDGSDAGYLVEYLDGGKPNDSRHAGYISWSPKEQFDNAYRPVDGMSFGLAIDALKQGKMVARAGWKGKGMWLKLVTVGSYDVGCDTVGQQPDGPRIYLLPWIGMKTADNKFVPWLASQTDMMADDWQIVE